MKIGENIQALRLAQNLSIKELHDQIDSAKSLKTSYAYLRKIENGETSPTVEILERLAKVLEVPVTAFFDSNYIKDFISKQNLTLGEQVKLARKLQRLNQKELAEKTGLSQVMISFIERNLSMPSEEETKKLAQALNLSEENLLKGFTQDAIDFTLQKLAKNPTGLQIASKLIKLDRRNQLKVMVFIQSLDEELRNPLHFEEKEIKTVESFKIAN